MASGDDGQLVAVTEAAIRAYYALRQLVDTDYAYRVGFERDAASAGTPGMEPRYRSLSLLAHGTAAFGNAGKVVLFGANPLAINVAQWAMFGKRIVGSVRAAPVGVDGLHRANRNLIDTGWARLEASEMPKLSVASAATDNLDSGTKPPKS